MRPPSAPPEAFQTARPAWVLAVALLVDVAVGQRLLGCQFEVQVAQHVLMSRGRLAQRVGLLCPPGKLLIGDRRGRDVRRDVSPPDVVEVDEVLVEERDVAGVVVGSAEPQPVAPLANVCFPRTSRSRRAGTDPALGQAVLVCAEWERQVDLDVVEADQLVDVVWKLGDGVASCVQDQVPVDVGFAGRARAALVGHVGVLIDKGHRSRPPHPAARSCHRQRRVPAGRRGGRSPLQAKAVAEELIRDV